MPGHSRTMTRLLEEGLRFNRRGDWINQDVWVGNTVKNADCTGCA